MNTFILGLTGFSKVGKDYLCDKLIKKYNDNSEIEVVRVAFADAIKDILSNHLGLDISDKEATRKYMIG